MKFQDKTLMFRKIAMKKVDSKESNWTRTQMRDPGRENKK